MIECACHHAYVVLKGDTDEATKLQELKKYVTTLLGTDTHLLLGTHILILPVSSECESLVRNQHSSSGVSIGWRKRLGM